MHKISAPTYLMRLYLLAEIDCISFTGNKPRVIFSSVTDPLNRSNRPCHSMGCRTTGVPGHPGKILAEYFPNAGRDIRSLFQFPGRGIQAHPCNTTRTKFYRSYRRLEHMGWAARRAIGIP